MKRTTKGIQIIIIALLGFSAVGCGKPSKSAVCGDCEGASKDSCEASYDLCDSVSTCSLKDLKKAMKDAC
jgi:hypothetical protein